MKRLLVIVIATIAVIFPTVSGPAMADANVIGPPMAISGLGKAVQQVPAADAYVDASNPSTNYGPSGYLRVSASPEKRGYLQFKVSGLSGTVSKATLNLYSRSSSSTGVTVHRVSNAWSEGSITFGNAPAVGSAITSLGTVAANTWLAMDVTSYVTGNGTYSFALTSRDSSTLSLASRESTTRPQLVVETTATLPTATATRSATATRAATATRSATATSTRALTATPTQTRLPTRTATPFLVPTPTLGPTNNALRLIGWNDLGMHCMNQNFGNLAVLPPYNTLWAQLIRPGTTPQLVTSNVSITYSIEDNTYSAGKTDFWQYAAKLFPGSPAATQPNIGIKGAGLTGSMASATDHFIVEGVPLTPFRDSAPTPNMTNLYPYQLADLVAKDSTTGKVLATTRTVAPVSTEMNCALCHSDGMRQGIATGNVETNILTLHDQSSGTSLMTARPVLCASCHGDNALGLPGKTGIRNLSNAMHTKHENVTNDCYNCHPGKQTQCLRDVMKQAGLTCTNCHGTVAQVADPSRNPWVDEPKCGSCHDPKYAENPGLRYRDSKGHGGLFCEACHGSPHAILPSLQPNDNIQNIALQGHAGTLSDCTVCHGPNVPSGGGPHN